MKFKQRILLQRLYYEVQDKIWLKKFSLNFLSKNFWVNITCVCFRFEFNIEAESNFLILKKLFTQLFIFKLLNGTWPFIFTLLFICTFFFFF